MLGKPGMERKAVSEDWPAVEGERRRQWRRGEGGVGGEREDGKKKLQSTGV